MGTVLGVDAGSATTVGAEHLAIRLAERLGASPGTVLCTHPVRDAAPHYAVTLRLPAEPGRRPADAARPAGRSRAGRAGRGAAPDPLLREPRLTPAPGARRPAARRPGGPEARRPGGVRGGPGRRVRGDT
jgi:hypothetical protein